MASRNRLTREAIERSDCGGVAGRGAGLEGGVSSDGRVAESGPPKLMAVEPGT